MGLPLSLKPRQRLTPTFSTEATVLATTAMASATMVLGTGDTTTARGRLRLRPRLRLSPTCTATAMDLATTAMASATTVLEPGSTTARGRLRLSPRLPLIPTCCTDTATAMVATGPTATPTAMAITTARGMLRLRLIPTSMAATTAMDSATATATVLATGDTTMDKLL